MTLDVAGLAAISAGGFYIATWLGLTVAGVGLLALSWLLST